MPDITRGPYGVARIAPVGPAGPPGTNGANGTNGSDGAPGLPGVNAVANDTATASYISTPSSATATALSTSTAPPQKASLLSRSYKAALGQLVTALFGMSITSFGNSPLKVVLAVLRAIYGDVLPVHEKYGVAGGSFEAFRGIDKQPYGGPFYVRGRLSPATEPIRLIFYGDTLWPSFSRESDSMPCNIYVDGVLWGTSTTSGAQAYRRRVVGATLARAPHVMRIDPPASGHAYLEDVVAFDSTRRGLLLLDYTIGGSLWKNMQALSGFGNVAGIAVVNDNGVKAHFDNPEYDLPIIGQDINDIADPNTVVTLLDKAIALVDAGGRQMGLLNSMGGVMVNPADGRHAGWEAIRTAYRTRAAARSDIITYFPWQDAVQLSDDRYAEYQTRYYAPGDGIHPGNVEDGFEGYPIGTALVSRILGLPAPTQFSEAQVNAEIQRRPKVMPPAQPARMATTRLVSRGFTFTSGSNIMTFSRPHLLAVGSAVRTFFTIGGNLDAVTPRYVVEVVSPTEVRISNAPGGAVMTLSDRSEPTVEVHQEVVLSTPAPIGYGTLCHAAAAVVPTSIHNTDAGSWELDVREAIAASSTSDQWGTYKVFSNVNVGLRGKPSTVMTWTFLVAGDVAFSFSAPNSATLCAPDGSVTPNDGQAKDGARIEAAPTAEPRYVAVHLKIDAGTDNANLNISGKVYRSNLAVGTVPTIGA